MYKKGEYTYGEPAVVTFGVPRNNLTIGKFCSIANGVSIDMNGEHRTDVISTYPFHVYFPADVAGTPPTTGVSKGDVVIGNDVWICEGVRILGGVTIGDGAVLGSRAVVAKDVPPYAIAIGNPVKVSRYRFSPEDIKKLLEIKWWDWPIEKIRKYAKLLVSTDVGTLYEASKLP